MNSSEQHAYRDTINKILYSRGRKGYILHAGDAKCVLAFLTSLPGWTKENSGVTWEPERI